MFPEIKLTPMKQINTPNGAVFHAIKKSSDGFEAFGEAYFSFIDPGAIKGWKKHKQMTLNLIVPIGRIRFVCYAKERAQFFEVVLGEDNYQRLTIAPGIWMAFQGVGKKCNMLLNVASIEHDAREVEAVALSQFMYKWSD